MATIVTYASGGAASADVLPALELLLHDVRAAPAEVDARVRLLVGYDYYGVTLVADEGRAGDEGAAP